MLGRHDGVESPRDNGGKDHRAKAGRKALEAKVGPKVLHAKEEADEERAHAKQTAVYHGGNWKRYR